MSSTNKNKINEYQITSAVKELIEFIQSQTKIHIFEQTQDMGIDRKDIEKLSLIVESSISKSFFVGIDNVVNRIKE